MVPESFAVGQDQLKDTVNNTPADKKQLPDGMGIRPRSRPHISII